MKYRLIEAEKTHHPLSLMARVPGALRQVYYVWKQRGPSRRACQDRALTETIRDPSQVSPDLRCPVHPCRTAAGVRGARRTQTDGPSDAHRPA